MEAVEEAPPRQEEARAEGTPTDPAEGPQPATEEGEVETSGGRDRSTSENSGLLKYRKSIERATMTDSIIEEDGEEEEDAGEEEDGDDGEEEGEGEEDEGSLEHDEGEEDGEEEEQDEERTDREIEAEHRGESSGDLVSSSSSSASASFDSRADIFGEPRRSSTDLLPKEEIQAQLEERAPIMLQVSAKDTVRDVIILGLKGYKVMGMWQQYSVVMVVRDKEIKLAVDDHPLEAREAEKGTTDGTLFRIHSAKLGGQMLGAPPPSMKILRRRSDEDLVQAKEKKSGEKEKAKKALTRMSSLQHDDAQKKSLFKSRIPDKPQETSLEKFGKDTRARSSSMGVFSSKKSASPTKPVEEVKFDKKKSKTGRLECFGVDITEQATRDNSPVPRIVLELTAAVEKRGLERVGIYRLSGAQSKVNRLQSEYMHGSFPDLLSEESDFDVVTISGVLKQYFRELPKAVFPPKMYSEFVNIPKQDLSSSSVPEQLKLKNKQMDDMKQALRKLPKTNLLTIEHIVRHLKVVCSHSEVNKMGPDNLSLLFGPSMMGGKDNSVFEMPLQSNVILYLLNNCNQVFALDDDK